MMSPTSWTSYRRNVCKSGKQHATNMLAYYLLAGNVVSKVTQLLQLKNLIRFDGNTLVKPHEAPNFHSC